MTPGSSSGESTPCFAAAALFFAVSTHVEDLGREKLHPVLLVDEAHLLYQDTLDHLHILLNYQWDSQALLSLVLAGCGSDSSPSGPESVQGTLALGIRVEDDGALKTAASPPVPEGIAGLFLTFDSIVAYRATGTITRPGEALTTYVDSICPGGSQNTALRAVGEQLGSAFLDLARHAAANRVTLYAVQGGGFQTGTVGDAGDSGMPTLNPPKKPAQLRGSRAAYVVNDVAVVHLNLSKPRFGVILQPKYLFARRQSFQGLDRLAPVPRWFATAKRLALVQQAKSKSGQ